MLRVSDILLRNLIWAAVAEDGKDIVRTTSTTINLLAEKIKACGITFRVSNLSHETTITINIDMDI